MRIAVIIPTYDRASYIEDALESVRQQTRQPDELVLVDDGSRDNTVQLVEYWSDRHGFPATILKQRNQGGAAARNTAVRNCQSDLIAPLDSDDVFLPHHLETLEQCFIECSDLVTCIGNSGRLDRLSIGKQASFSAKLFQQFPPDRKLGDVQIFDVSTAFRSLLRGAWFSMCSAMFRRSHALEIGLFDESLRSYHDQDFWLRLSRRGPLGIVNSTLSLVRKHDDNLTATQHIDARILCGLRVRQKMLANADVLKLSTEERAAAQAEILKYVRSAGERASYHGLYPYLRIQRALLRDGWVFKSFSTKPLLRAILRPQGSKTSINGAGGRSTAAKLISSTVSELRSNSER